MLGGYLFFGLPIGYRPFCWISIGYRPFYRIAINDRNQGMHDICSIFLLPGPAASCSVCGLCVCTGCTMCGVTEVKLKLFTVLEKSVASVEVTSYYVMSRNVSVSRCRAMAEAVSCWPVTAECRVASRTGQCETSVLYSGKLYVIRTVRVITIILSSNTCSLLCTIYDITPIPTCFATKVS
jgi:hypothetical protein